MDHSDNSLPWTIANLALCLQHLESTLCELCILSAVSHGGSHETRLKLLRSGLLVHFPSGNRLQGGMYAAEFQQAI